MTIVYIVILFTPLRPSFSIAKMTIPSLRKVEIQLTTACNMECGFCFANAGRNKHLPTPLAKRVITELSKSRDATSQVKSLWLTGGEAMLRKACPTLVETADGLGLKTGIATNGLLLAQKAGSLKTAGLKEVRVSLDAVRPALFDQIRGTHKALPHVLRGIEAALKTGLQTAIRFTATKHNASELAPVIRQAREMGVHHVEVKAVLPIGRASTAVMLPPAELGSLMTKAIGLSSPQMPVTVLCSYLSLCKGFDLRKSHVPCVCATEALYVDVKGTIMPCSYFPSTSPHNIMRHSLRDAWTSNDFAQIRNERPPACGSCPTWENCRNGCPALLAHYSHYKTPCFSLAETLRRKGLNENVCLNG
jgi:cyclic pyranopterin phosphate synthase